MWLRQNHAVVCVAVREILITYLPRRSFRARTTRDFFFPSVFFLGIFFFIYHNIIAVIACGAADGLTRDIIYIRTLL